MALEWPTHDLFFHIEVRDPEKWLAKHRELDSLREEYGIETVGRYQSVDDPGQFIVHLKAEDLNKAVEYGRLRKFREFGQEVGLVKRISYRAERRNY